MMKRILGGIVALAVLALPFEARFITPAFSGVSCSLPFTLTNGTIADATQVMSNYNAIISCLANAAAAGNNSDITSLAGLTTPIPPGEGGTPVFIGGTSTGAANAQIVGTTTPANFTLTQNYAVVFTAGFTNTFNGTTGTTLTVAGQAAKSVFRQTPSGPQALTGGEIVLGNLVVAIFDGTEFQLVSNGPQFGGFGPVTGISTASLVDLGTIPSHNVFISGVGSINSFGTSASLTYPVYNLFLTTGVTLVYNQTACGTTGSCILLPGGANITATGGDTAVALYLGAGSSGGSNWQIISYQRVGNAPGITTSPPQGYLGLINAASGGPILGSSDATAITTIFYTPYVGNLIPIWNGAAFAELPFSELSCALSGSAQSAGNIYDVFIFNNAGVITCAFGPAWATSTAGAGARGSGGGTTQISRLNGIWVNTNALTSANNGASTFSVPANQGTYVGSIFVDGTNGQVSGYRTWGSSRKFGVWNAYNRTPICLLAGDSTASWTYNTSTIRESRGQTTNTLAVFAGLPEEWFDTSFLQVMDTTYGTGTAGMTFGVGWNSTTAFSGTAALLQAANGVTGSQLNGTPYAQYFAPPQLGVNNVNSLETASAGGATMLGTQVNMLLRACWRG